jgi:hypothetical protein
MDETSGRWYELHLLYDLSYDRLHNTIQLVQMCMLPLVNISCVENIQSPGERMKSAPDPYAAH